MLETTLAHTRVASLFLIGILGVMDLRCVAHPGTVLTCRAGGRAVTLHTLHEKDGSWQFQSIPGPPLNCESHVIACQTALDSSLGITVPFLATCRPDNGSEVAIYSLRDLSTDKSHLTCRGTLHVPDYSASLIILNGPTVVWSQQNTVFIARQNMKSMSLTSRSCFTQQEILLNQFTNCVSSIEQMWSFDSSDDTVLLFIRQSATSTEERGAEPHWNCLSLWRDGDHGAGELSARLLPSQYYVPSDYGCIATCMTVHRRWCVGREGDVTSDLEVLVGTQYMQVVLLRGGIPLHCIATDTTPSELTLLKV